MKGTIFFLQKCLKYRKIYHLNVKILSRNAAAFLIAILPVRILKMVSKMVNARITEMVSKN